MAVAFDAVGPSSAGGGTSGTTTATTAAIFRSMRIQPVMPDSELSRLIVQPN